MSKIAIIGFGREGKAVYKYLRDSGLKIKDLWILDRDTKIKVPYGARKQLGKNYLRGLERFDLVFRSPGIPYVDVLKKLQHSTFNIQHSKITSATKLFFTKCPCPIIAVTGTKGKGTTATLLYLMLKRCGWDAHLTGNIGTAALETLPQLKANSIVVLEISSFQLQDLDHGPRMAVVVDVFPDHLDHHKNLKEYYDAKAQIAKAQSPKDVVFYLGDNKLSAKIAQQSPGRKISVWHYITAKERSLLRKTLKLPGQHNFRNAQAALAVAKYLGCLLKKSLAAIAKFTGNEHRLELVRILRGVRYYNDSANTDPEGTVAAARAFKEPKIIIAGGKDKGLNYKDWKKTMPINRVKYLILLGENKLKIRRALGSPSLIRANNRITKIILVKNLKEAVLEAKTLAETGWVVILSPGAASFDMFKSYAERGQKFKRLVRLL